MVATTAQKGGVWGPGALPTDGTSIFPVTGNTGGTSGTWGGGEAVIRLARGADVLRRRARLLRPANWAQLDNNDTDLGGASEVSSICRARQYPHLSRRGQGREPLRPQPRRPRRDRRRAPQDADVRLADEGAPAAYTTAQGTYVAFHSRGATGEVARPKQGGNIVVMQITQSPMAAKTLVLEPGGPRVADGHDHGRHANPIVWNADDALYGWNGDTGAVIVDGSKTGMGTALRGGTRRSTRKAGWSSG